jgi:hypothetical protein
MAAILRSVYWGVCCWPVKAFSFYVRGSIGVAFVYGGYAGVSKEKARIASLDRSLLVRLCCIGLWHDDE